jgi:LCP family protein required for cell wall assembly
MDTRPSPSRLSPAGRRKKTPKAVWVILLSLAFMLVLLAGSAAVGGTLGHAYGQAQREAMTLQQASQQVREQFDLGLADLDAGRLDVARQRFEWVLSQEPEFPGAVEKLAEAMAALYATATPTPVPPTLTPTPTPDLRPVQELFTLAKNFLDSGDWSRAIDTAINLRRNDPDFQVTEVDRILFLALRYRGAERILQANDLEGGIYDLALAGRFGPLDVDAQAAREWARLYLIGSSFWEVFPEKAVFYFSQVASALPYLRDASGWTAIDRLRESYIHWGNQLMEQEDWCTAQAQYEAAMAIRSDGNLQAAYEDAYRQCTPPTETVTPTPTWTATPTLTATSTDDTLWSSPTTTLEPSATFQPTATPSPTQAPELPTETPTPTDTPVIPTETPTGTPSAAGITFLKDAPGSAAASMFSFGSLFTLIIFLGMVIPDTQPVPSAPKPSRKKHPSRLKLIIIILVVGVLAILLNLGTGIISFLVGRESALFGSGMSSNNLPQIVENAQGTPINPQGTPVDPKSGIPESESQLPEMPAIKPWDGAERVTILLLGLDYRDWEARDKYSRSDTMILLTLDPLTNTAGILSIPRDMWVAIPGFQHGKINTAYYLGDAYQLPGGGPALAVKTVESFLGIPINYYAQVDFEAFVRFIDEIGGVKIDVPQRITIDLLGDGANTIKNLKPGSQVLPGEYALAYARARHTEGGDFDRAGRQQQVILGIRNRILNLDMLPTLIAKAPQLYQELASGIRTNLSLEQATQLALLAQKVPDENIKQGILGKGYVLFGESPDKLSILIPLPDKIHELRDTIFASSGSLGPGTPGSSLEQMIAEASLVEIKNASGIESTIDQAAAWLTQQGGQVSPNPEAIDQQIYTTVIDHTGNPYTIKYLVETLKINPNRIYQQYDPLYPSDVELILGKDWIQNNPLGDS